MSKKIESGTPHKDGAPRTVLPVHDISPIELERIMGLGTVTAVVGIEALLDEKVTPLIIVNASGQSSPEDSWQLSALMASRSVIHPHDNNEFTAIYYGGASSKPEIERTLRYMKFLGFSERELSAQGILEAKEKQEEEFNDPWKKAREEEEETGVINLAYRRPEQPFERSTPRERQLEEKIRELKKELQKAEGIDPKAEDDYVLLVLDMLMLGYEKLPPREVASRSIKRLVALTGPASKRKTKQ